MKYKTFSVLYDFQIDGEINRRVSEGYELVQVIPVMKSGNSDKCTILMRISKENDPTEKLAATILKTIANINANPNDPTYIALRKILVDFRDGLNKKNHSRSPSDF